MHRCRRLSTWCWLLMSSVLMTVSVYTLPSNISPPVSSTSSAWRSCVWSVVYYSLMSCPFHFFCDQPAQFFCDLEQHTSINILYFPSNSIVVVYFIFQRIRDCSDNTHTHNRLTALCPGLPGWAGTRRNIHPLTPILIIGHPLSSSSIYNDRWHPLCSAYELDSPLGQPFSRSSLVFPLVLDPQLHTPYISSPNQTPLNKVIKYGGDTTRGRKQEKKRSDGTDS